VPGTFEQSIKIEANRLGFSLAGITTPDPPPHGPVYENWLALGRHGEMMYLAKEPARSCRLDPRLLLPDCRSILVLGVRHPTPHPHTNPPPLLEYKTGEGRTGAGRIAAYAWGRDYHLVLPEYLLALVAFIEACLGHAVPSRVYTDTGPILERDLAQRAGLGWIGKNTCLINPRLGSYLLLAEILLSLDLSPDTPFAMDRCGTCTRCIDTCPTGAILPNRTLDARRCVSYLTIELKGEIPLDLRPSLGDWVFGCDVCQVVCPWNRIDPLEDHLALMPHPGVPSPDLIAELTLSPQEFNRKFKDSPIRRAKRRGYLRNVAVALGNTLAQAPEILKTSGAQALAALEHATQDSEPLIREHATWAFKKINRG